jgi:hypothetical protein
MCGASCGRLARGTIDRVKLLLTLLALLTGFSGGDALRQIPATPAALGAAVAMAEAAVEARVATAAHRPLAGPVQLTAFSGQLALRAVLPPIQQGFGPRGVRAHE